MNKCILLVLLALLGIFSPLYAQMGATKSAAASQAWVEAFVSNAIHTIIAHQISPTKNGVTTMDIQGGKLTIYENTDYALRVTNSVSSVTNDTLFVWNGNGKYINPIGEIEATKTNMIYKGVASEIRDELLHFEGFFDVEGVMIPPQTSLSVTNNLEVVQ